MAINQWDKGSKNNGPNAYKKGNRTGSRREAEHLKDSATAYKTHIETYKRMVEERRRANKYRQEAALDIYNRVKTYIAEKTEQEKPFTISGLILASGMSADTYYRMTAGEYDYRLLEYIDMYNIDTDTVTETIDGIPIYTDADGGKVMLIAFSQIFQKAQLMIAEQTEERLYSKGRVGDIFALKAQHGWQEERSPQTVNQTLVIATEEQARKAIDLLK